jgi:hypothetical protein
LKPPRHINSDFSKIFLPAALVVLLTNSSARAGPKFVFGIGAGQIAACEPDSWLTASYPKYRLHIITGIPIQLMREPRVKKCKKHPRVEFGRPVKLTEG